jgi:hypothetical protein
MALEFGHVVMAVFHLCASAQPGGGQNIEW